RGTDHWVFKAAIEQEIHHARQVHRDESCFGFVLTADVTGKLDERGLHSAAEQQVRDDVLQEHYRHVQTCKGTQFVIDQNFHQGHCVLCQDTFSAPENRVGYAPGGPSCDQKVCQRPHHSLFIDRIGIFVRVGQGWVKR